MSSSLPCVKPLGGKWFLALAVLTRETRSWVSIIRLTFFSSFISSICRNNYTINSLICSHCVILKREKDDCPQCRKVGGRSHPVECIPCYRQENAGGMKKPAAPVKQRGKQGRGRQKVGRAFGCYLGSFKMSTNIKRRNTTQKTHSAAPCPVAA